jgi:hypothetical protein
MIFGIIVSGLAVQMGLLLWVTQQALRSIAHPGHARLCEDVRIAAGRTKPAMINHR